MKRIQMKKHGKSRILSKFYYQYHNRWNGIKSRKDVLTTHNLMKILRVIKASIGGVKNILKTVVICLKNMF